MNFKWGGGILPVEGRMRDFFQSPNPQGEMDNGEKQGVIWEDIYGKKRTPVVRRPTTHPSASMRRLGGRGEKSEEEEPSPEG